VKTYGGLFERVYDFESLHAAYRRARSGKRDQIEVQKFEQDLEGNLIQLQNELIWGTYQTGRYRTFIVNEPKERVVSALPFRDRVVQHALVAVIEPIWEARFIADNYACRPGRGTHRGADRAEAMLRKVKREHGKVYVLKGDVARYFPSIDHKILKGLFAKRIRCQRTLALLNDIIDSSNQVNQRFGVGVPIGNLVSQLAANVYLHELDLFAKHDLRERYYIRYMDDFVVVHHDKAHLHKILVSIESYLNKNLKLNINKKTQIFPVSVKNGRSLDFLGYQIWPTHRRLRRDSITRVCRNLKSLQKFYILGLVNINRVNLTVRSWCEHASKADTYRLRKSVMRKFILINTIEELENE
jgi:RNA-directed DNA polymerase